MRKWTPVGARDSAFLPDDHVILYGKDSKIDACMHATVTGAIYVVHQ